VARTSALTGLPDAAIKRQISVPTIPVAPTTRVMESSLSTVAGPSLQRPAPRGSV